MDGLQIQSSFNLLCLQKWQEDKDLSPLKQQDSTCETTYSIRQQIWPSRKKALM